MSGKAGGCRWRPRRYHQWSGGREVARGVLRSSPKHEQNAYFLPWEGIENFLSPVFYIAAPKCVCIRRPPPITGRFVNTMIRGWVGAPNERAPFGFHGAVVVFVDRCLSRSRNLAASNNHFWLSLSQADLGPRSAQEFFFRGF